MKIIFNTNHKGARGSNSQLPGSTCSRYQVQPGNEVLEASPHDYCVSVEDVSFHKSFRIAIAASL